MLINAKFRKNLPEAAALAALLGFFVALVFFRFDAPGRIWDGLRNAAYALRLCEAWESGDFYALTKGYPLYHGTLHGLLWAPLFYLFGPSWSLVKLWPALLALGAMTTTFLLVRNLFGRTAAFITTGLWVIHPAYLMATRMAQDNISGSCFFVMGVLYFLERWWTRRRDGYLFAAALLLGFGFGTFLWYLWFVAALAAVAAVFSKDLLARIRGRERDFARVAGLGLLPGLLPILRYEFVSGFESWRRFQFKRLDSALSGNLFSPGSFLDMLSSRMYFGELFASGWEPFTNEPYGWIVMGSLLWLAGLVAAGRPQGRKALAAGLVLLAAMLLQILFLSPRMGLAAKLVFLYPFPQIILGTAAAFAFARGMRAVPRAAAAGLLCLAVSGEVLGLAAWARLTEQHRGTRDFTYAIYELADWVKSRLRGDETLVSDFFTPDNLRLLVPGARFTWRDSADLIRGSEGRWDPSPRLRREDLVRGPDVYVLTDCWHPNAPNAPALLWPGAEFEHVKTFFDRDGAPVMRVHRKIGDKS